MTDSSVPKTNPPSAVRGFRVRWWMVLVPLLGVVIAVLVVGLWNVPARYRVYSTLSRSMEPTILSGERFWITPGNYRPLRGDVVLLRHSPEGEKQPLFVSKRVIALPGDVVEGTAQRTLVNGKIIAEPYIMSPSAGTHPYAKFGPLTVPADQIFVMGDNRDISLDSRVPRYGPVYLQEVIGRAEYIVWSSKADRVGKRIH